MLTSQGTGTAYWIGNLEFATLKLTRNETNGAFALVELVAMPGAEPPPHVHHGFDEAYYLLEGELEILDGPRTYTATLGSVVYFPRGTAARLAQRDLDASQGASAPHASWF